MVILLRLEDGRDVEARLGWRVSAQGQVQQVTAWPVEALGRGERLVWEVWPRGRHEVQVRVGVVVEPQAPRWAGGPGWTLGPHTFDPYAHLRHEEDYVAPWLGVMWRCPPGQATLCRKALLAQSYPEQPLRLRLVGLTGARDPGLARRLMLGLVGSSSQAQPQAGSKNKTKTKPKIKPKIKIKGRRGEWSASWDESGQRRWMMARLVGKRWVLCEAQLHPATPKAVATKALRHAATICRALRPAPGFEPSLDCVADAVGCAALCRAPDQGLERSLARGLACASLAEREPEQASVWAQLACHQAAHGPSCARLGEHELACALGDADGCVAWAKTQAWPWRRARALARACELAHAQGCALAAQLVPRASPAREGLAWRACALGQLEGCALLKEPPAAARRPDR